ncbi:MAG: hypothetical protein FWF00_00375 [Endomicrobia bacterium]|nr:hypothetical protein [Endomicrobiia bacterium]MCL2506133.1 hypothetical protein [Endomicrobiia bacterium]
MKKAVFLLIFPFLLISCSVLDYPARIAGFSIQKFENEQVGRFEEVFEMSKKDGFNKMLEIISKLRARVTHKSFNKGYIVAFEFTKSFDYCLDSTEAAFFFEVIDNETLKVTVVCNNSLLARNISQKVFEMMRS